MRKDKKSFTFWLVGFGCGIILSGLIGVVMLLNTDEYKNSINTQIDRSETTAPTLAELDASESDEDLGDSEIEVNNNLESDEKSNNEQIEIEESGQIIVNIPSGLTASETCKLLEEYGVVEDGDAFNEYIRSKQKTTKLREGEREFPKNATYEEVLDLLLTS